MARPRKSGREDWPEHLICKTKNGNTYYSWRHPETGKEYMIGADFNDAADQAREANAEILHRRKKKPTLAARLMGHEVEPISKTKFKMQPFQKKCGIYLLHQGDVVVYVGQSTDIYTRVSKHHSDGKIFDYFSFIECEKSKLNSEEVKFIRKFSPKYNVNHNSKK